MNKRDAIIIKKYDLIEIAKKGIPCNECISYAICRTVAIGMYREFKEQKNPPNTHEIYLESIRYATCMRTIFTCPILSIDLFSNINSLKRRDITRVFTIISNIVFKHFEIKDE
jgi:hypothetical protein